MRALSLDRFRENIKSLEMYKINNSGDNSEQSTALKRVLRSVIDHELTERQREIIILYYFEGKNILEIGECLCINKSTVSRHLGKARVRIERVLRYGYFPIWKEIEQ